MRLLRLLPSGRMARNDRIDSLSVLSAISAVNGKKRGQTHGFASVVILGAWGSLEHYEYSLLLTAL